MKRRTTTILAADIVGYSRMVGADNTATLAAISRLRNQLIDPLAAECEGTVFRVMGDGTLLEFASAVRALEFAIHLQKSLSDQEHASPAEPRMVLRVGVNLGEIAVENGDMHGDGVNIAVRLQEITEPGGICVSHTVYPHVRGRYAGELMPIGERILKNIAEPVQVWRWAGQDPDLAQTGATVSVAAQRHATSGYQVLDPRLTNLILDLHARSARLAVSDAFDRILARSDGGKDLEIADIYQEFGEGLNYARGLLNLISVERVENHLDFLADNYPRQMMSEFISGVFDSNRTAFAFKLLPEIQAIIKSDQDVLTKRKRFMEYVEVFLHTEFLPLARKLIKYSYVQI